MLDCTNKPTPVHEVESDIIAILYSNEEIRYAFTSIPYSRIQTFSIETSGTF